LKEEGESLLISKCDPRDARSNRRGTAFA
jgi:hypothetical protein